MMTMMIVTARKKVQIEYELKRQKEMASGGDYDAATAALVLSE